MGNPLRSEADAFRFLVGAVVAGVVIALVGLFGGGWAALGLFLALVAGVSLRAWRGTGSQAGAPAPRNDGKVRLLVVADCDALRPGPRDALVARVAGFGADEARLLTLPGPDAAEAELQGNLTLSALLTAGVRARGAVLGNDPIPELVAVATRLGPDAVLLVSDELWPGLESRLGSIPILGLEDGEARKG